MGKNLGDEIQYRGMYDNNNHNSHIAEYTLHGKKLNPVANAKYLGIKPIIHQ